MSRPGIISQIEPQAEILPGSFFYINSQKSNSYPGTGNTVTDLSGNSNNATLNNVTFNSTKKSFVFNGSNSYIDCNFRYSLTTGSENFSVFISLETTHNNTSNSLLISSNAGTAIPFNIYVANGGRAMLIVRGGNNQILILYSTTIINDGNKHTVCARKNGTSYSLFVDGVVESTGTKGNSSTVAMYDTVIGTSPTISGSQYYSGEITNSVIYNSALTDQQILDNSNILQS